MPIHSHSLSADVEAPPTKSKSWLRKWGPWGLFIVYVVTVIVIRATMTSVSEHAPTAEQARLPQPPFCEVREEWIDKLFYFDLGATYCLCEKQWDVGEYWEKTLSGLAFNVPHLLTGFIFSYTVGLKFTLMGLFLNEFIEEFLLAVTGHWGFNYDLPYDLEPRYDSLMRDIVHTTIGAVLGWELRTILNGPAWLQFPLSFDFHLPSSNRQSWKRWLKTAAALVTWWQLFLLYNLDSGIKTFSRNNLILTLGILAWFLCMYLLNRDDFPDYPPRLVAMWHVVAAITLAMGAALSIYPLMSTIYLIMFYEGVITISFLLFEIAIAHSLRVQSLCGFSALSKEVEAARILEESSLMRDMVVKQPSLRPSLLEGIASTLTKEKRDPLARWFPLLKSLCRFLFGIFMISVACWQPFQYEETQSITGENVHVSYQRHWCGNPKGPEHRVNTCAEPEG